VHWTANGAAGALTTSHTSPPLTMSGLVSGVSANPAGDLWAAGYASPPGAGDTTLVLRGSGG
jgi:hypothetical protein